MVSAVDFKAALTRYKAKRLPEIAKALQQETAAELGRRIVRRTPVKTGLARGNMRLGIGRRRAGSPTTRKDPSGSATIAAIANSSKRIAAYSNWSIYSLLRYVPRLERGYSKQAPRGMFRISMRETVSNQRKIKGNVLRKLGKFNVR